jgi:hypothetical protein
MEDDERSVPAWQGAHEGPNLCAVPETDAGKGGAIHPQAVMVEEDLIFSLPVRHRPISPPGHRRSHRAGEFIGPEVLDDDVH